MRIEVDADVAAVSETLHRMARRTGDMRPVMTDVARMLEDATARKFQRGGEGDWPRLDMKTLERRRRAGISSRRILVRTGALRRSLTSQTRGTSRTVRRDSLQFGTTVPYAQYVARRRNPLPDVDRQLQRRMAAMVEQHVRHP